MMYHFSSLSVLLCMFIACTTSIDQQISNEQNHQQNTDFQWSESVNGLRLGIKTNEAFLFVRIENTGNTSITTYSHVLTHEKHYDWFSIRLFSKEAVLSEYDNRYIPITLMDSRDKSAAIFDTLQPGEHFEHMINLHEWIGRDINQNLSLEGEYQIQVIYENKPCTNCNEFYKSFWTGNIESPTTRIYFPKLEQAKLSVRILHHLPVGWGNRYSGIISNASTNSMFFEGDTIEFGMVQFDLSNGEIPSSGDMVILTVQNSGKFNEFPYQPACNCTVSKNKEIWNITDIHHADK